MNISRVVIIGVAAMTGGVAAWAGDLNPPAGAIAPTHKTLTQVEPRIAINAANTPGDADSVFRIAQSGSYYLTGNVTGQANKHGIEIAAGAVTLDLNGFVLSGGGANRLNGIHVNTLFAISIVIRNGAIDSWTGDGINAENSTGIRVERIDMTFMSDYGLRAGANSQVSECSVTFSQHGFRIGANSLVERCRTEQIFETGLVDASFTLAPGCVVTECVAANCGRAGFSTPSGGLTGVAWTGCTFRSCTALSCSTGFSCNGSTLSACLASDNAQSGFFVPEGALSNCVSVNNGGIGIVGSHSTIVNCRTQGNGAEGISGGYGSVISRCVASQNGGHGIAASEATRVESCTANFNDLSGILAGRQAQIIDNACHDNDGAGILVTQDDGRIEGNVVQDNAFGLDVDGVRNVIIRNQARGNGQNYAQVAAGNIMGTVVTTSASMNAAGNDLVNLSF